MVRLPTNDGKRPPGKAHLIVPAASATADTAVPPRCREIVAWAITHGRDSAPWGEGTEAFALLGELVRMAQASPQVALYLVTVIENRSAGANASFGGQPERFLMEALAETGHEAAIPVLTGQLLRPDEASSDARRRWRAAAIALGRLRDPRAIPVLKQAQAMGRAPQECQESIEQLGGLGPVVAPATPAGREELQEADREAAEVAPAPTEPPGPAIPPPKAPAGESLGEAEPEAVAPADARAEPTESTAGAPAPRVGGCLHEADQERTEPPDAMPEQEASAAALAPAPPGAGELGEAAMGRRPASVPPPAPGSDLEEAVQRYSRIADLLMTKMCQDGGDSRRPSAEAVRQAIQRAEKAPQDWSEMPALWPDLIRVAVTSLPQVREAEARRVLLVLARRARPARGGLDATLTALFRCMARDGEGGMASGSQPDCAGRMLIRNIKSSKLSPSVVHLTLCPPGSKTSHLVVRIGQDEYLLFAH
jgi:hypothetical protein